MLPRLLLVVVCILAVSTEKQEHKNIKLARSSFFYDKKILQKLIRLEHKAKLREQAMRDWETRMENTLTKFEQKKTNMSATIATADNIMSDIQSNMTAWETAFQENLQSHNLTVQSFLGKSGNVLIQLETSLARARNALRYYTQDFFSPFWDWYRYRYRYNWESISANLAQIGNFIHVLYYYIIDIILLHFLGLK